MIRSADRQRMAHGRHPACRRFPARAVEQLLCCPPSSPVNPAVSDWQATIMLLSNTCIDLGIHGLHPHPSNKLVEVDISYSSLCFASYHIIYQNPAVSYVKHHAVCVAPTLFLCSTSRVSCQRNGASLQGLYYIQLTGSSPA